MISYLKVDYVKTNVWEWGLENIQNETRAEPDIAGAKPTT